MLSTTATSGAKSEVEANWYDEVSATNTSVPPAATASKHVSPMLPTALAATFAQSSTCAISAVVVVLPFVPVTATQRESAGLSRQASSTSLMISVEAFAAQR